MIFPRDRRDPDASGRCDPLRLNGEFYWAMSFFTIDIPCFSEKLNNFVALFNNYLEKISRTPTTP